MTSELRKCLSILFRQKGKDILSEKEFVYAISMDLHWFSPKEAQKLLGISIKSGLLTLSQGMLSPTFEPSEDQLPIGYKPSSDLLRTGSKPKPKNIFLDIVGKISSDSKLKKKEIVSRINKTQEQMGIDAEVAALVVARSLNVHIGEEIPLIEQEIVSRTK